MDWERGWWLPLPDSAGVLVTGHRACSAAIETKRVIKNAPPVRWRLFVLRSFADLFNVLAFLIVFLGKCYFVYVFILAGKVDFNAFADVIRKFIKVSFIIFRDE